MLTEYGADQDGIHPKIGQIRSGSEFCHHRSNEFGGRPGYVNYNHDRLTLPTIEIERQDLIETLYGGRVIDLIGMELKRYRHRDF
mmetsp:Transcript_18889/g.39727  ORF Transcript_18889/g.39727 Transcript_18889/m.39727 type:complete len:85 (-) Transcript_18889:23-277(-)